MLDLLNQLWLQPNVIEIVSLILAIFLGSCISIIIVDTISD